MPQMIDVQNSKKDYKQKLKVLGNIANPHKIKEDMKITRTNLCSCKNILTKLSAIYKKLKHLTIRNLTNKVSIST
jgi:hypothetical protein